MGVFTIPLTVIALTLATTVVFGLWEVAKLLWRKFTALPESSLPELAWRPPPEVSWEDLRAVLAESDPITRETLERCFNIPTSQDPFAAHIRPTGADPKLVNYVSRMHLTKAERDHEMENYTRMIERSYHNYRSLR